MASAEIPLNALVEVPVGRGIVRFCGTTSFAQGKWVGIELSEPKGKNDGSVQGVQYFTCRANFGMFVRPSQVKVVAMEPATPAPNRTAPTSSRPALGHQRTGSTGVARVSSLRATAPPSPRATSPAKSGTSSVTSASPRVTSRFAPPSPTKRAAAAPPPAVLAARKAAGHGRRSSVQETKLQLNASVGSARKPEIDSPVFDAVPQARALPFKTRVSSPPPPPQLPGPSLQQTTSVPAPKSSPIAAMTAQPRTSSPLSAPSPSIDAVIQEREELQELHAKIRVLEAKRADDARHVRELETKLADAETFVSLRPKLQAKLTQQQTELITTRRELADAKQLADLADSRIVDAQEQLEMAMLDKEVAEERAEAAEAEVDELKEKLAVVEVELGVMKESGEGGEEGAGTDPQVTSSMAYIQLERQNSRLKEALIRLREITQETEQEQRRRIADMEKDVMNVDELQTQLEETLIQLSNAETQVDELKGQLDDALGAEEMLMQLTERNLMLGEKIEEMRITIEDLEALKELNDELEENHLETEKSMQEEIDEKDIQMRDQQRKIDSLDEACQDYESTINQFRELVLTLQSELDALRTQTQTAQNESAAAASQSAAVMSMNLKLQSTASKNQAKNIDLEVKRIEAKEARELLSIVQPYLPQIYVESDSAATQCYLFFQRMALKADLVNMVVAQIHGLPEALNGPVSDTLVGVCDMRGAIATLSTVCKRFAAILRKCDVESFLNIGRLYPEIAPMEKRIDMHIELLRREEFREMECVTDINKIQAQFDHLAETYFEGFEYDLGERELGFVLAFDHDLDIYASSLGLTKTAVETILADDDVIREVGEIDVQKEFFEPIQKSLDLSKSAKITSKKLTKRLEDLTENSSALKAHLAPQLKGLSNFVSELVNFGIQLAQQIMPHISEVRSSRTPFQMSKVLSFVNNVASSTVGKSRKEATSSWAALNDAISQVISEANALLPVTMENENVVHITGTAPWVLRVAEIKANLAINVEAERKVAQLNEEMQGLMRTLKTKDQNIQEAGVKIELMERRMETQERAYEEAMEQLQTDLDALEQENTKLKAATVDPERKPTGNANTESENIAVEGSLETSHLLEQLEAFRGAVRFLRMENSYLKGQDLLKELQELPPLPAPAPREPTPPLDPSGLSDTDDSDSDMEPAPPTTLRALATERKALYRDVIRFSSSPRLVDLSAMNAKAKATGEEGTDSIPYDDYQCMFPMMPKCVPGRSLKRAWEDEGGGVAGRNSESTPPFCHFSATVSPPLPVQPQLQLPASRTSRSKLRAPGPPRVFASVIEHHGPRSCEADGELACAPTACPHAPLCIAMLIPEEKKETQKKKTPTPKKKVETGVWPCKIDGCNKEFAREADLKRHQRTTKLHSLPGFACPQCEATFTRTDALRRHQKSRHNGVIIEPDQDKGKGPQGPPGEQISAGSSKSRSRSGTPGSKNKGQGDANSTPPNALAQPGAAGPGPGAPPGYYRQHGMNTDFLVFVPPRTPQGIIMDPNYQAMGIPTSAARMHQSPPNWPPPPPWVPDGQPMGYPPMPGAPPAYFPYYRPGMLPPHMTPEMEARPSQATSAAGVVDPQLAQQSGEQLQDIDAEMKDGAAPAESLNAPAKSAETHPSTPVIDPSLENGSREGMGSTEASNGHVSLEITAQAMEAVLLAARQHLEDHIAAAKAGRKLENAVATGVLGGEPPEGEQRPLGSPSAAAGSSNSEGEVEAAVSAEGGGTGEDKTAANEQAESQPPSERVKEPPQMHAAEPEHMLTEDGEPMLNPAELLTQVGPDLCIGLPYTAGLTTTYQESLASPPPS
ncbi:hypothetical protein EVG20_g1162 [Dentipellis fragilis]|uniref:CAP-Gly domain-containing protein n=1 Tax=Dentipellis fragilis TaxID=205917 RepID=A0A4Y9ZAI3_9AGAM|nr:hypothetical protein EVG20_g1162 [Dentipellis fragilis]